MIGKTRNVYIALVCLSKWRTLTSLSRQTTSVANATRTRRKLNKNRRTGHGCLHDFRVLGSRYAVWTYLLPFQRVPCNNAISWVHLVVLHLQSTEHERYSFKSCVWIRRLIPSFTPISPAYFNGLNTPAYGTRDEGGGQISLKYCAYIRKKCSACSFAPQFHRINRPIEGRFSCT